MSSKKEEGTTRRDFFKKAGAGVGAAGAAAVVLKAEPSKAAAPVVDGRGGRGYQETEHVKTYYKLARF